MYQQQQQHQQPYYPSVIRLPRLTAPNIILERVYNMRTFRGEIEADYPLGLLIPETLKVIYEEFGSYKYVLTITYRTRSLYSKIKTPVFDFLLKPSNVTALEPPDPSAHKINISIDSVEQIYTQIAQQRQNREEISSPETAPGLILYYYPSPTTGGRWHFEPLIVEAKFRERVQSQQMTSTTTATTTTTNEPLPGEFSSEEEEEEEAEKELTKTIIKSSKPFGPFVVTFFNVLIVCLLYRAIIFVFQFFEK